MNTNTVASCLLALLLVGCASTHNPVVVSSGQELVNPKSPVSDRPLDQVKNTVDIDKELLVGCSPMAPLIVENPSPEDVLAQKATDVKSYSECRRKNSALITLVRKAFNLKME